MTLKPYYQDDKAGITIYNGDCMEIIPQLGLVEVILTDPPYNAKNIGPNERVYEEQPMQLPQEQYKKFCREWFSLGAAKTDRIIFTPGISNVCFYPQPYWIVCWHKPAAVSFNRMGGFNAWEPIMIYGKAQKKLGQDVILCNTLNFTKGAEKAHPCPKPPTLMTWMVEHFSKEGETILEPFCGSGTTLWAAKDLGRKAIGIEKVEKYCEIAAKRLSQEVLNFKVLTPETSEGE